MSSSRILILLPDLDFEALGGTLDEQDSRFRFRKLSLSQAAFVAHWGRLLPAVTAASSYKRTATSISIASASSIGAPISSSPCRSPGFWTTRWRCSRLWPRWVAQRRPSWENLSERTLAFPRLWLARTERGVRVLGVKAKRDGQGRAAPFCEQKRGGQLVTRARDLAPPPPSLAIVVALRRTPRGTAPTPWGLRWRPT